MPRWLRRHPPQPDPLGHGVWRRADDRFRRAVDRYHQVLDRVDVVSPGPLPPTPTDDVADSSHAGPSDPGTLRRRLVAAGDGLADLLPRVHAVCLTAQALGASDGDAIPPGPGGVLLDVHRTLARSATLVAQAAESVTMVLVTVRAQRPSESADAALAAQRAAEQAAVHVARAESLIRDAQQPDRP